MLQNDINFVTSAVDALRNQMLRQYFAVYTVCLGVLHFDHWDDKDIP